MATDAQNLNGVLKSNGDIMEFEEMMNFLEMGKVGVTISVEDAKVIEVRVKEKIVDINILNIKKLGKLKEEFKKWKA